MAKIKICSISDQHGFLPTEGVLKSSDVLTISGDTFPLDIQRNMEKCENWLLTSFNKWVEGLPVEKVIMIAGNHDFYFGKYHKLPSGMSEKLVYLEDSLYDYKGITFYGCPWCTGPWGWAFTQGKEVPNVETKYELIPKCDVLLTHQPPHIGSIGTSYYENKYKAEDFSSDRLAHCIYNVNSIVANFCGHVHTGNHIEFIWPVMGCNTKFYNCSLMDEAYQWAYPPTYTIYDTENRTISKEEPSIPNW